MFLVCTFLVFILIVQLKLESCNEQKKKIKWKKPYKIYILFFSVYVVPVTAGTVFGILALSKPLELCSLSHCNILEKNSLVFSMMAAKFVFFKWILPLFVLIDIILVYYKLLGKKYIKNMLMQSKLK